MCRSRNFIFLSFWVFCTSPLVLSYKMVLINRLPSARAMTSLSYDGEDSIFVVGGLFDGVGDLTEVVKYTISENKVEIIAHMPFEISSAAMGNNGGPSHFHFGGYTGGKLRNEILKFTTENPTPIQVGELPRTLAYLSATSDKNGTIYILGGQNPVPTDILRFDIESGQIDKVGDTPEPLVALTATWVRDSIYGFGGYYKHNSTLAEQIFRFNPSNGEMEIMEDEIAGGAMYSASVRVGDDIYIIGGRNNNHTFRFSKFNTLSNRIEYLEVDNFPKHLLGPTAAYVERLNRIYIFGGSAPAYVNYDDEIFYIQL